MSNDAKMSPFLSLPGELRNRIYDLVFENTTAYLKANAGGTATEIYPPTTNLLSLTLVNRQIHQETAVFPYVNTKFAFEGLRPLHLFVHGRTKSQLQAIQELRIGHPGYWWYRDTQFIVRTPNFAVLARLSGLKKVTLVGCMPAVNYSAEALFQLGDDMLKARPGLIVLVRDVDRGMEWEL